MLFLLLLLLPLVPKQMLQRSPGHWHAQDATKTRVWEIAVVTASLMRQWWARCVRSASN